MNLTGICTPGVNTALVTGLYSYLSPSLNSYLSNIYNIENSASQKVQHENQSVTLLA